MSIGLRRSAAWWRLGVAALAGALVAGVVVAPSAVATGDDVTLNATVTYQPGDEPLPVSGATPSLVSISEDDTAYPASLGLWIGGRSLTLPVTELPGPDETPDVVVPDTNLRIRLVLDDDTRTPVGNTQVELQRHATGESIAWGTTDADGFAALTVNNAAEAFTVIARPDRWSQPREARSYATTQVGPVTAVDGVIEVVLLPPNVEISVIDDQGNPVRDSWVWLYSGGTSTGANSNAAGKALFSLDDSSGLFQISASPPWDRRDDFSYTSVETALTVGGDGVARATVTLATPNVRARIVSPDDPNVGLRYSYVEVVDAETDWYVNYLGADENGMLNGRLDDGTYRLLVRPSSWEVGSSAFGTRTYDATVVDGVLSVAGATQSEGRWQLTPSRATFTGSVVTPQSANVRNSWVEVFRSVEDGEYSWLEWVDGAVTGRDGTFGVTLADGEYLLRANPPWGNASLAESVRCTLTGNGGSVNAGASTCDDGPLALREPNLAFTIVDGLGNPQAFASACLAGASEWRCAWAGRNGKVSLIVDDTETLPGGNATLYLEPPWGVSGLTRTTATVPAADIGVSWGPLDDRTLALDSPNLSVTVSLDGVGLARDGYVSAQDATTGEWLTGGQVGRDGVAGLSLDDLSEPICLAVWPGWQWRATHGEYRVCGVVVSGGEYAIEVPSANTFTTVVDADGRPNAWSWVQVEADGGGSWGISLDEGGRLATSLADGSYSLTFYPGWQRSGVPTTVAVSVSGGVSNLAEQVTLGRGNVTATVLLDGTPLAGAIVSVTVEGQLVTSVSDAAGGIVLSLPVGGPYPFSILPPPGTSGTASLGDLSSSASVSGGSITVTAG